MPRYHMNPDGTAVPVPEDIVIGEGTRIGYMDGGEEGVANNFTFGKGVQIGSNCNIERGVTLCDGVIVGNGCTVEFDTFIGANSTVGRDCRFEGRVSLAPGATVGNRVQLVGNLRFGAECEIIEDSVINLDYEGRPGSEISFPAKSIVNVRMTEGFDL